MTAGVTDRMAEPVVMTPVALVALTIQATVPPAVEVVKLKLPEAAELVPVAAPEQLTLTEVACEVAQVKVLEVPPITEAGLNEAAVTAGAAP